MIHCAIRQRGRCRCCCTCCQCNIIFIKTKLSPVYFFCIIHRYKRAKIKFCYIIQSKEASYHFLYTGYIKSQQQDNISPIKEACLGSCDTFLILIPTEISLDPLKLHLCQSINHWFIKTLVKPQPLNTVYNAQHKWPVCLC